MTVITTNEDLPPNDGCRGLDPPLCLENPRLFEVTFEGRWAVREYWYESQLLLQLAFVIALQAPR